MNKVDYHKELEKIIQKHTAEGVKPSLLLHCCCAPCASYCLTFLKDYFNITCYFYNPNITEKEEYDKRFEELKKFVSLAFYGAFEVIDGGFNPEPFLKNAKGREALAEGGERCFGCYALRLSETSKKAEEGGYDYFATTLTVSPHKRADKLNEIGCKVQGEKSKYLPSDFKKKGGYLKSIQLSTEYNLYRQNYCGCIFSKREN